MQLMKDGSIVTQHEKRSLREKHHVKRSKKFLNQFEVHKLLSDLDLGPKINWDWMILLIAKTGMRFSEALALTPADFDFYTKLYV